MSGDSMGLAPASPLLPTDLIDEKYELMMWWASPEGKRYSEKFCELRYGDSEATAQELSKLLVALNMWMMEQATPFWISGEMVEVCYQASKSMPPQPLRYSDIPCDCGFMYLNKRIVLPIDAANDKLKAIGWAVDHGEGSREGRLTITYYVGNDPQDWADPEWAEMMGAERGMFGTRQFQFYLIRRAYFGRNYLDDELPEDEEIAPIDQGPLMVHTHQEILRFLLATWAIMDQRIASKQQEAPGRQQRRRWQRRNVENISETTVITLRRVKHATSGDEKDVNWTHRWLVDGHWRNQWFPSLGPVEDEMAHRHIWISPHVKGPEHLPLVVKDKVYKLSR